MEQDKIKNEEAKTKNQKIMKIIKIFVAILVFSCLIVLLVLTFINYKNIEKNEQTLSLYQNGMTLRNNYETLRVTRIQGTSYSQFPYRVLEIHADENTMYSYRDDFYKDYSEPANTIDKEKVIIYLTERQVFDNPVAVAEQPECEAMVRIESQKRTSQAYENEPTEITLKYISKEDSNMKLYIYTPKLGHCERVFSDKQLIRVHNNANSIRYSF